MTQFNQFIGNISEEDFFNNYWQKTPLVVRRAYNNPNSLANFSDLRQIGKSERFETRMVLEKDGEYPWQALEGPFSNEDLDLNNNKTFTLIAHNLNLYFKEFYQFQKMVDFLPSWLFDDVMATYSTTGATVGPHVDNYNVFILQGKGSRKWQIQENPDKTYHENFDIKLLKNFQPTKEYILEEGDMIYIPPQVAHNGISLSPSLSYSIGFRAFNYKDMIFSYFNNLLENYSNYDYFKMNPHIPKDPRELSDFDFHQISQILNDEIISENKIKDWFAKYVSEPRFEPEEIEEPIPKITFSKEFQYFKDEHLRINYFQEENNYNVYINGQRYKVNKEDFNNLFLIFSNPPFQPLKFPTKLSQEMMVILTELYNKGAIFSENLSDE